MRGGTFPALLAAAALLLAAAAPLRAQLWNKQQLEYLAADPNEDEKVAHCQEGAMFKMQVFYHLLREESTIAECGSAPEVNPCACAPVWLKDELAAAGKKAVWQDPNEGVLSEVAIWQGPVSVLYEYFTILQKTFPPDAGGQDVDPKKLDREFADNRTRFVMSLDRLYKARHTEMRIEEGKEVRDTYRMGDSFQGRGRAVIADFELAAKHYESLLDGIIRNDTDQFINAAISIAQLSHRAFGELHHKPRLGLVEPGQPPKQDAKPMIFLGLSVFLIWMAALQFGQLNKDLVGQRIEEYGKRTSEWANEFNRQFLNVKVHYLVLGPWALFTLAGVATGSPFLMLFCTGLGLYVGLTVPTSLLSYIKASRGRQVELQLIEALTLLGNALKSGLDLVGGFRLVQRELLPPISEEFGLVIKNYELGTPFGKALEGLDDRVDSRLVTYMVKAIVIQQQVGGNIIKIFDRLISNIREEAKLAEKTAAMTAQQRIQSIVVGIMPWVMVGVMFIFQGEQFARFYTQPIGMTVLIFCVVWIGIGMKVVSSMGNIKV